jgi:hypothetical protein
LQSIQKTQTIRTQFRVFHAVLFTHYCSGDKIENNEMGEEYSACGREERCIQGFGGETWGKETTWEIQAQIKG